MDHTSSKIFEKNYLSRQIRYDTKAAYLGRDPDQLLIQAANRMSRLQDPNRPKRLSDGQREQVRHSKAIQDLYRARERLSQKIHENFDTLKEAQGAAAHTEYLHVQRLLVNTIRFEERSLLKQAQHDYDRQAPIDNIERQLNGEDFKAESPSVHPKRSQLAFLERVRIGEALFSEKSLICQEKLSNWRIQFINDLMTLCGRRERRTLVKSNSFQHSDSGSDGLHEIKILPQPYPLRCEPYQCLFCLGSIDLAEKDRRHDFANRYSLRRHLQRNHQKSFRNDNDIKCPHPHVDCVKMMFKNIAHFKNHAARVHFVQM